MPTTFSNSLPTHLVVGLGQTGWSCVRYLCAQGHLVLVVDSRQTPPYASQLLQQFPQHQHFQDQDGQDQLSQHQHLQHQHPQHQHPQVRSHFGSLDALLWEDELFSRVHTALVSPGLDLRLPFFEIARQRHVDLCGDIEWYARHHQHPLVAITATNGKSTVTDWLGFVLKGLNLPVTVAGNIGVPVLEAVLDEAVIDQKINSGHQRNVHLAQDQQPLTQSKIVVLELSSYQLETCQSLRPNVATLLNVAPDHLDRYSSYDDYQNCKRHIYYQSKTAVLAVDQPACWPSVVDSTTSIGFGSSSHAPTTISENHYWGLIEKQRLFISKGGKEWRFADELPLQGQHNLLNALAVLALLQGLKEQGLITSEADDWWPILLRYQGLPHRCQRILHLSGADWFDDSKATNVGAAVAAINGLGQRLQAPLMVILGGAGKQGADYEELVIACERYAKDVILMGAAADLIHSEFIRSCPTYTQKHCHVVTDMQTATELALQILLRQTSQPEASQTAAVLLSPACASFDQYNNYVERGLHFQDCVKQLSVKQLSVKQLATSVAPKNQTHV